MKTIEVKGSVRTELGKKGSKNIRKQGNIPCVMYGGGEVVHFTVHENAVKNVVYTAEVYLIQLDLDGKSYQAVLKDMQFHPVNDKVIHMDFSEVVVGKTVQIQIPVQLVGNSIGIKNGGKLRLNKRYLTVKGEVTSIPEHLVIDITKLKIGGVIKVQDLNFEGLELTDTKKDLVVGIVTSRVAAKGMEVGEDEEEGEDTEGEAEESAE